MNKLLIAANSVSVCLLAVLLTVFALATLCEIGNGVMRSIARMAEWMEDRLAP